VAGEPKECFPRNKTLPGQSPLFWVENKDRYLRQLLIGDIEADTGRDLLVYFTDCDRSNAQIDQTDDIYLSELLGDRRSGKVDLLIETNGGFTDATEKVCSVLRNANIDLRVIVPRRAKSNGTVIAFCGSSIVMGDDSELGPVDPNIILNGSPIPCDFVVKSAGQINDPLLVQYAQSAMKQTRKLAKHLLGTGMLKGTPDAELDKLLDHLATRDKYHSHGSVIDVHEALSLKLKVEHLTPDKELWKRIWLLRTMYSFDCRQRGYSKLFEARRISSPVVVTA
jgi:hypothetical protein